MRERREPGAVARALRQHVWVRRGLASFALSPLAGLYRAGVALNGAPYALRLRRPKRVAAPVVSVGNVTVGGTGKTPASLWLAGRLREAGLRPAIVTRGYGGALGGRVLRAQPASSALGDGDGALAEVGDEAALLAERFPGPVVCGIDRVAAAEAAIERYGADVVVLDDGFQHRRLERDLDIVLVDGRAGFGNGALLPAGPLREPASALHRADAVVVTKGPAADDLVAEIARRAPGIPTFAADLIPKALVGIEDGALVERPLGAVVGRRIVTVSGIAQPSLFYEFLGQLEARAVEVLEFADHHAFSTPDWQRICHAAHAADLVVCTEKDLVKLRRFPFARGLLVALRVDFALAPEDEAALLGLALERIGAARPAAERR